MINKVNQRSKKLRTIAIQPIIRFGLVCFTTDAES
jgi:hypothetical protein